MKDIWNLIKRTQFKMATLDLIVMALAFALCGDFMAMGKAVFAIIWGLIGVMDMVTFNIENDK